MRLDGDSGTGDPLGTTREISPMTKAISQLHNSIDHLEQTVSRHIVQLAPILIEAVPNPDCYEKEAWVGGGMCDLEIELLIAIKQITLISAKLGRKTELLQI